LDGPSIAPQKQFHSSQITNEDGKDEVLWAMLDEIDEIRHVSKVPVSRNGYLDVWGDKGGVGRPY
jgi:hypothetical protein